MSKYVVLHTTRHYAKEDDTLLISLLEQGIKVVAFDCHYEY